MGRADHVFLLKIMAKVRLQAKHIDDPTPSPSGSSATKSSRPQSAIEVLRRVYKEKVWPFSSKTLRGNGNEETNSRLLGRYRFEHGFKGWYQGMSAQIFKAVLSQGILLMLKVYLFLHFFLHFLKPLLDFCLIISSSKSCWPYFISLSHLLSFRINSNPTPAFLLLLLFSKSTSSVISKAQIVASHVPHPDVHLPSSLPPLPSSLKEAQAALPSIPSLVPAAISEKVPGLVQDVKGAAEASGEKTGVKATVDLVVNAVEGK
jgi:hypothetical protein